MILKAAPQILQQSGQQQSGLETQSQIIIPASQCQQNVTSVVSGSSQQPQQQQQQQTHQMVIPLQTSIKVTSGAGSTGTAVVSNFLRKRDMDGSPIRAAKNLQPTLLSMGTGSGSGVSNSNMIPNSSPASSSIGSSYSLTSVTSTGQATAILTAESLAKKDRMTNILSTPINSSLPSARSSRADSPASSDGSTTVSANSSPGVEQQIQDNNMIINRLPGGGPNIDSHFNPINEVSLLSSRISLILDFDLFPSFTLCRPLCVCVSVCSLSCIFNLTKALLQSSFCGFTATYNTWDPNNVKKSLYFGTASSCSTWTAYSYDHTTASQWWGH